MCGSRKNGEAACIHLKWEPELELEPRDSGACDPAVVEVAVAVEEGDTAVSTKLEGAILCEDVRSCAID